MDIALGCSKAERWRKESPVRRSLVRVSVYDGEKDRCEDDPCQTEESNCDRYRNELFLVHRFLMVNQSQ